MLKLFRTAYCACGQTKFPSVNFIPKVCFSNTNQLLYPDHWLDYNDKIFPPLGPDEEKRLAYVCHQKLNIKYSPKKMWYVACLIRGMSIDEALKQLQNITKKGSLAVRETLLEAQRLAVEEHNVEYKSNLWVAESFCTKGFVVKGIRRHARMRMGIVEYKYCHYYVRLEEGPPPKIYYYQDRGRTGPELLDKYMNEMRRRRIRGSL